MVSFFLGHNRKIENRCDDSIGYHLHNRGFSIIRRSRGYAPVPIELPSAVRPTLAVGPYLKNTFTLANNTEAYVSPHIGDLDNLETLHFFEEMVEKYKRWFRIEPQLIVHDLHPDYLSTKIARNIPGERIGVQHHVAHFLSCLGKVGPFIIQRPVEVDAVTSRQKGIGFGKHHPRDPVEQDTDIQAKRSSIRAEQFDLMGNSTRSGSPHPGIPGVDFDKIALEVSISIGLAVPLCMLEGILSHCKGAARPAL